jgi:lysyl-tRNA synthetase class 2
VVSAATGNVPWRERLLLTVESGSVMSFSHVLAGAVGVALIVVGRSMARGTRRALDVARVLLIGVAVLHLAKGLDFEEGTVALAMAAVLTAGRGHFDRGAAARPRLIAAAVAVGAAAGAWLLCSLLELVTGKAPDLGDALELGVSGLTNGGWWLASGEPLAVALDILVVIGLAAGVVFLRGLLRAESGWEGHAPAEHASAARVVREHGLDSLAPFLLREDKSFFFAHGGVLGYRVLRETAVVSGDPVCPPGAAPRLLAAFIAHARAQGWNVAVAAATEGLAATGRALGLRALCVGQEAVVDPREFTLEGRAVRKLRQSVSRAGRRGWRFEVATANDLEHADIARIARLENHWRSEQRRLQGFAMTLGRLGGAPEDRSMLHVLARAEDRRIGAVLRFVPYANGLSLDAMRRSDEAPNGLTEALVCTALEHARDQGLCEVSLNFAGFGHLMAPSRALSRRERAAQAALRVAHGRFQLERLSAFSDKFAPVWRPRYLLYEGRSSLVRSGLRVLQAEAYVRAPYAAPLESRWKAPEWPQQPALPGWSPAPR